jgi:hypothetical protein
VDTRKLVFVHLYQRQMARAIYENLLLSNHEKTGYYSFKVWLIVNIDAWSVISVLDLGRGYGFLALLKCSLFDESFSPWDV